MIFMPILYLYLKMWVMLAIYRLYIMHKIFASPMEIA